MTIQRNDSIAEDDGATLHFRLSQIDSVFGCPGYCDCTGFTCVYGFLREGVESDGRLIKSADVAADGVREEGEHVSVRCISAVLIYSA